MKIGVITSPFGPLPPNATGAVERLWYYIADCMASKGHAVTFYSKKDSDYNLEDSVSISQITGFKRSKSIYTDIVKDFIFTVKALIRLKPCDILVQNTFWVPILSPLVRWKYKKSVYNVARVPKGQFKFYGAVDQFSCVSEAVKDILEQKIGKSKKIVMVGNPINLDYFKFSHKKMDMRLVTIGYHGRIHREKGLNMLCSAAQKLSEDYNLRLLLIGPFELGIGGSGPEYVNELKALCPDVEVIFTGGISSPVKLNEKLAECDIYCYPSAADMGETFGVSPLEAMGTGRPVVVSGLACFRDFIEDGVTGLVFDHHASGAVNQLAGKIKRLISEPRLRNDICRAAYEKSQEFSIGNITEQYLLNFTSLLADSHE